VLQGEQEHRRRDLETMIFFPTLFYVFIFISVYFIIITLGECIYFYANNAYQVNNYLFA
jgi:hypothetical protein